MNEFDWIETYLKPLAGPEGLELLDDAALLKTKPHQDLVLTQDTLIEGVHFSEGEYGAGTAERLMIVNLSDLAAKGARPLGYLLSVTWPRHLQGSLLKKWMEGFCKGLESQQNTYDFKLFGGDTVKTSGPMTVSATFIGTVPENGMVKRSGAKIGDDVWVTGTIGDAHLGLLLSQDTKQLFEHGPKPDDLWTWEEAFRHPIPRLLFRKVLRKYATACADISDGLLSEAKHIAKASGTSLSIHLADMPLSKASQAWCDFKSPEDRRLKLATGGDDYELLFTVPTENAELMVRASQKLGIPVTKVGQVGSGKGLDCIGLEGTSIVPRRLGYSH